jgi:hypothetical protein
MKTLRAIRARLKRSRRANLRKQVRKLLERLERLGGAALAFAGTGAGVVTVSLIGAVACWIIAFVLGIKVILQRGRQVAPQPHLDALSTEIEAALWREFHPPRDFAMGHGGGHAFGASATDYGIIDVGGTIPYPPSRQPVVLESRPAPRFARVRVTNDSPSEAEGIAAENVTATVAYYNAAGDCVLGPLDGRWASSKQRHEWDRVGLHVEPLETNIPARAKPRPLDIAMKYAADEECYAFNNDNAFAHEDGRLEKQRLGRGTFRVELVLRASNIGEPIVRSFVLTNPGAGGDVTLEPARAESVTRETVAGGQG